MSVSVGLTGSRQTAKNSTFTVKRAFFTVNSQRKQLSLALKQFQGLSNLAISASHVGLLALKE